MPDHVGVDSELMQGVKILDVSFCIKKEKSLAIFASCNKHKNHCSNIYLDGEVH